MSNPFMAIATGSQTTQRATTSGANPFMDVAKGLTPVSQPVAQPTAPSSVTSTTKPASFVQSLLEVPAGLASGMGHFAGTLEQGLGGLVEKAGSIFDGNANPQHYNKLERIGRIISRRGEDITQNADLYEPVSMKGKVAKVGGDIAGQIVGTLAGATLLPGAATGIVSNALRMAVASAPITAAYSYAGESLAKAGADLLGEDELSKTLAGNAALRIAADLGLNTVLGVATDLGFAKLGQIRQGLKKGPVIGNVADIPQDMPMVGTRALPPGQYNMPGVPEPITDPSRMLPQSTMIPGVAGDVVQGPALPLAGPAQPQTVEEVIARAQANAAGRTAVGAMDPRIEVIPAYEPRGTRTQNRYRGQAESGQAAVDKAAASNRAIPMPNEEATAALESARIAGQQARAAQGGGYILHTFGVPGLETLKTEVGKRALRSGAMVGTGLTLQESEDERLQATGKELVAWGVLHALYPSLKSAGATGGTALRDALMQSETGTKVLNALSYDFTMDPRLRDFADQYEQMVAKGKARAAELEQLPKGIDPSQDRRISDMIERENFEPITGKDTPLMMAHAQRLADEFSEMGRLKVETGLLSQQTVDSYDRRYLKRMYGQQMGQEATTEAPMGPGRKVRIQGDARRKDLPPEVRNALGEIREASFRAGNATRQSYRDIAAAKLFHDLTTIPGAILPESMDATKAFRAAAVEYKDALAAGASKEDLALLKAQMSNARAAKDALAKDFEKVRDGYVRMPDTPGMGTLRGVVVRKDVADYLDMLPSLSKRNGYLDALQYWKAGKTVWNPGTHVGNVSSNVVMAHMGGLPIHRQPAALQKAWKAWTAYDDDVRFLAETGVLDRGLPTFGDPRVAGSPEDKLRALYETTRPETRAALERSGITPKSKFQTMGERIAHGLEAAYGKEDGVFRVALFKELTGKGMPREEAAKYVAHQFVDYSTRSPILRGLSRTASPFVMFPAKALPRIMDQVIEKPERWMTLMALWGGMDQLSRNEVGPMDFADVAERDRRKGYLLPNNIQLPWSDADKRKFYLDLTRWTPFSSLTGNATPGSLAYGMNPSIPGVLQPSNPVLDIGARLANTDPFTGEKILNSAMSPMDKAKEVGSQALQVVAPTAVSFHLPRVRNDVLNADYRAAMVDALGFLGMKPRVVTPGNEARSADYDYDRELAFLRQRLRKSLKAAENSPMRQEEIQQEYQDGLDRATQRYHHRLGVEQQQQQKLKPQNMMGNPGVTFTPR